MKKKMRVERYDDCEMFFVECPSCGKKFDTRKEVSCRTGQKCPKCKITWEFTFG